MAFARLRVKVHQNSKNSSHTYVFYNGFCKVYEKNKLNIEGLYFTIVLGILLKSGYVCVMLKVGAICSTK